MGRTLLDEGLMVQLINRELVNKMTSRSPVYRDSRMKISLANDTTTTLSKFVKIFINVQGVKLVIRAWLTDVKIYDLLLGVLWMRRVNCTHIYGKRKITIMGQNLTLREVPTSMTSLSMLVVQFKLIDEE